jgi:hypothetical protein
MTTPPGGSALLTMTLGSSLAPFMVAGLTIIVQVPLTGLSAVTSFGIGL